MNMAAVMARMAAVIMPPAASILTAGEDAVVDEAALSVVVVPSVEAASMSVVAHRT
jgi:hypothetical protein